jgi:Spy/CpxP family protein refolding chaperone
MMTKKLFLIAGFVLTLSTLGFAAANAGAPPAPDHALVGGQVLPMSYD